jgi:pimeloyl-ACP methyl ester carboxylesterase
MNILILHGWGSCAKNWSRVKELLENQGYKIYLPDLPGFGQNSSLSKPWSIDDYVAWVKEYSEKQNLSQFFLLGHSFGGSLAIKFSLKYPERIKKMFLVASAGIRKKTIRKKILGRISKFFKIFSFLPFYSFIRKIFYKFIVKKSDYPYLSETMRETYLNIINEDLSGLLFQVTVPTIIIWGEKDDVVSLKEGQFINQNIKNSKLLIIPGANHDLERKAPEILVQKILNSINL